MGSEYAWAYAPLLVFSVAVALLGFTGTAGSPPAHRGLVVALGLVVAAVLLQLVPLPARLVAAVSPARESVNYQQLFATATFREVDAVAPASPDAPRPLSIEPSRSWLGLAFVAAFALLLVGSVRGLGITGASGLARGIVVLGAVAAFLEIFQRASVSSVIYGLVIPRQLGHYSAPFVNRNHTAGWLLMALSLSLGHLAGCVARGMPKDMPAWRDRILWLSTSAASETVLTAFAIAVMAIAIVLTQSRSGALCLVLVTLLFGWWGVQRQASGSRRVLVLTHLVFVLAAAAVMGGVDAVARRFSEAPWRTFGGRIGVWNDAIRIIQDFPLTGTGLNTFGIAMLHYQTASPESHLVEAHNDYLQLASEGGWLLGLPLLILLGMFVTEVRRRFRAGAHDARAYWLRAGAVIALCAIAFQSAFDFTLQMPGAAAMFVVTAAVAIHDPRPATTSQGPSLS